MNDANRASASVRPDSSEPNSASPRLVFARLAVVTALGCLSVVLPKLGLAAGFLTLLAFLTRPRKPVVPRRTEWSMLAVASLASAVGTLRFLAIDAPPGIVQGSRAAQAQAAVSELRLILRAQDALRQKAFVDPDDDGIGSAGFIDELTGAHALRGGGKLPFALLDGFEILAQPAGAIAASGSYLFRICLPTPSGSFVGDSESEVDEEQAERAYWAFAWPHDGAGGPHEAFAMDQDERIFVNGDPDGEATPFRGTRHAPNCDAARDAPGSAWRVWRNKQARRTRPGDRERTP